jgi:hypothetical protein
MIVMGDNQERLQDLFGDVKFAGRVEHPLSMPYEHFDVFVCRNSKFGSLAQVWPQVKRWN